MKDLIYMEKNYISFFYLSTYKHAITGSFELYMRSYTDENNHRLVVMGIHEEPLSIPIHFFLIDYIKYHHKHYNYLPNHLKLDCWPSCCCRGWYFRNKLMKVVPVESRVVQCYCLGLQHWQWLTRQYEHVTSQHFKAQFF